MKKNIRLLVSILLLTISIFVCNVKANALTKLKAETDAEFFDRIEQIHESSNEEFVIELTADIIIDKDTVIKNNNTIDNGNTVTIIGNGHTYSITVGNKGRFRVSNGTLNLGLDDGSDTLIIQGAGNGVAAEASLVTVDHGTANMYAGVTLKDNRSGTYGLDGAAVRLNADGNFNMYGGLMTNNSVESSSGGGGAVMIDQPGALFTMYDGEISNNYTVSWGGAICLMGSGSFDIKGGKFINNEGAYGGAIANVNGIVSIQNATFDGNESSYGGAILNYESGADTKINISNSKFINNTSSVYGGAILNWGTEVTSENSVYKSNSSKQGGAIFNMSGDFTSTNDKIYNNTAEDAAGVFLNKGTCDFSTASVFNNKASNSANDYYISSNSTTTINSASNMVSNYAEFNNKSVKTLNWYNDGGIRYSIDNPTAIVEPTTVANGGTFYLTASSDIEVYVVTFETNDGSEVDYQVIDVGSKVSRPADPTKYGYNFINWYSDSELNNLFDFDSVIGSSVTLYAKWEPIIYEVTEGNGSEVERENEASFTINGPYNLFGKVYVDDELVEDSNYTSHEGSTVIVFSENYLSTLALGTHNLKVVYNNGGVATGTFTIKEKSEEPSTPDDSTNNNSSEIVNPPTNDRIMEYVTLLLLSISGISTVVVYKKREN